VIISNTLRQSQNNKLRLQLQHRVVKIVKWSEMNKNGKTNKMQQTNRKEGRKKNSSELKNEPYLSQRNQLLIEFVVESPKSA
jgi:hypothetical protein